MTEWICPICTKNCGAPNGDATSNDAATQNLETEADSSNDVHLYRSHNDVSPLAPDTRSLWPPLGLQGSQACIEAFGKENSLMVNEFDTASWKRKAEQATSAALLARQAQARKSVPVHRTPQQSQQTVAPAGKPSTKNTIVSKAASIHMQAPNSASTARPMTQMYAGPARVGGPACPQDAPSRPGATARPPQQPSQSKSAVTAPPRPVTAPAPHQLSSNSIVAQNAARVPPPSSNMAQLQSIANLDTIGRLQQADT